MRQYGLTYELSDASDKVFFLWSDLAAKGEI